MVNGGVEKEQHAHTPDPGWIAIAEGNRSSSPARSRLVVARRRGDAETWIGAEEDEQGRMVVHRTSKTGGRKRT